MGIGYALLSIATIWIVIGAFLFLRQAAPGHATAALALAPAAQCIIPGALGFLLVMKKAVLQCSACSAVTNLS